MFCCLEDSQRFVTKQDTPAFFFYFNNAAVASIFFFPPFPGQFLPQLRFPRLTDVLPPRSPSSVISVPLRSLMNRTSPSDAIARAVLLAIIGMQCHLTVASTAVLPHCNVTLPILAESGMSIALENCLLSPAVHGTVEPSSMWHNQSGVVIMAAQPLTPTVLVNISISLVSVVADNLCAVFALTQSNVWNLNITLRNCAIRQVCQGGLVQLAANQNDVLPDKHVNVSISLLHTALDFVPHTFGSYVSDHLISMKVGVVLTIHTMHNVTGLSLYICTSALRYNLSALAMTLADSDDEGDFEHALLWYGEGFQQGDRAMVTRVNVTVVNSSLLTVAALRLRRFAYESTVVSLKKLRFDEVLVHLQNATVSVAGATTAAVLTFWLGLGSRLHFRITDGSIISLDTRQHTSNATTSRTCVLLHFSQGGAGCVSCRVEVTDTSYTANLLTGGVAPGALLANVMQAEAFGLRLSNFTNSTALVSRSSFVVAMRGGYMPSTLLMSASWAITRESRHLTIVITETTMDVWQSSTCSEFFCTPLQSASIVIFSNTSSGAIVSLEEVSITRHSDGDSSGQALPSSSALVLVSIFVPGVPSPTAATPTLGDRTAITGSAMSARRCRIESHLFDPTMDDGAIVAIGNTVGTSTFHFIDVTLSGRVQSLLTVPQAAALSSTTIIFRNITGAAAPTIVSSNTALRGAAVVAGSASCLFGGASKLLVESVRVSCLLLSSSGQPTAYDAVRSVTFASGASVHLENCEFVREGVASGTARVFSGTAVFSASGGVALECNRVVLNGSRSRRLHAADVARDMTSANARTLPLTLRDCTYDVTATVVLPPVPRAVVRTASPTDVYRAFAGIGVAALAASVVAASPTGRVGTLQVSSAALRIRQRCRTSAAREASDADGGGAALSLQSVLDNPLQLPLGDLFTDTAVADAASTVIGNGVLVIVAALLHGLVTRRREVVAALKLSDWRTICRAVVFLMPGPMAATVGSQLQPTVMGSISLLALVGASVSMPVAVAARAVAASALLPLVGIVYLLLRRVVFHRPFPLRCVSVRTNERFAHLRRAVDSSGSCGKRLSDVAVGSIEQWCVSPFVWKARPGKIAARTLLQRYEPWFGELRDDGGRVSHTFGVADVVLAFACAVVSASALAYPELCAAPGALEAFLAVVCVFALCSLLAYASVRPMATTFGNASAVLTQCVCVLVIVLCIAGADDAAAWIALLQSVVSLIMSVPLVAVSLSRLVGCTSSSASAAFLYPLRLPKIRNKTALPAANSRGTNAPKPKTHITDTVTLLDMDPNSALATLVSHICNSVACSEA